MIYGGRDQTLSYVTFYVCFFYILAGNGVVCIHRPMHLIMITWRRHGRSEIFVNETILILSKLY